ncbi:hypothetical protein D187_004982 [Cystobacter fuscus DSM 2262]|uniref:Uncharacterized protein n=1 Tax=Cystobacter fuscus (strain ATCC 25194 / DSM 2262 / NBRC 100088 / M29) TaxID=1242864 RepID=S9R4M0_CYSF2|nr:hypothetical protein D187_004982 [Cystobacter fuscus DSM 2262]
MKCCQAGGTVGLKGGVRGAGARILGLAAMRPAVCLAAHG